MSGTADRPFTGPPIATIPLDPPPLARVLSQIRFAPVLAVAEEAFAAHVQQRLRDEYPLVTADTELAIAIGPGMETPQVATPTRLWRFSNGEEGPWRVTLATNFVAVETTEYAGHDDYFGRLERVLAVVEEVVNPPQVERTGVRYIQRITDTDDLTRLAEYVRPEIIGVSAVDDDGADIGLCLTQMQAAFEDVKLTARWGWLPPYAGVDAAIEAVEVSSWIMDIDVFDGRREPFDGSALVQRALEHSRRQYRFFRWAVEPAFLLRFGADPELVDALTAEGAA